MNETQGSQRTLFIIGLGVSIPGHVSVAATEALMRCERIYTIVQEPPAAWLPSTVLATMTPVNLLPLYIEGADRPENYQRVASEILMAALKHRAVGYVTYGNPFAYDSVAQLLVRRVPSDCRIEVVPAVSSIDAVLCDLRRDMAPGIQIFEASWLVGTQTTLNPSVQAILLQLGHFGTTRAHYRERRGAESLNGLVDYLLRFYPDTHIVELVQSKDGSRPTSIWPVTISALCTVEPEHWGETMFIPALTQGSVTPN